MSLPSKISKVKKKSVDKDIKQVKLSFIAHENKMGTITSENGLAVST